MAKLKAPLFSLGATGAIGKALVYFGWKGLDVVREYVVPANPRTGPQTTQRGYLTEAVDFVHACQATALHPLDEEDTSSLALWGSTYPTPRTWFNQIVKGIIDQLKNTDLYALIADGHLTPGAGTLTMQGWARRSGAAVTTGNLHYGTSKTALIHTQACTEAQLAAGQAIAGLTAGTKYYVQWRPTVPAGYVGARSGIYYGTPT